MERQMNLAIQQLMDKSAAPDDYKFDDVHFQRELNTIKGMIKNWANGAFDVRRRDSGQVSETIHNTLKGVSTHYSAYMNSNDHRPAFVQAFIWNHLLNTVFGGRFWEASASSQPYEKAPEERPCIWGQ
jgi:hypothetical protein